MDFLKCQTSAASPAEPGELPFWFSADAATTAQYIRTLEDWCCVERREGYLHIAAPIREAVRRDQRFEKSDDWRSKLGATICDAVMDYRDDDHIPVTVLQVGTLAAARSENPPAFLSNLILPSHFLRVARDYYDRDKRRLCMEFCKRAYDMRTRLPIDARVEVLRLWGAVCIEIRR